MDLFAYSQIDNLEEILKRQNIAVPRLRGLRLMKDEEIVSDEAIEKMIHDEILDTVRRIVEQGSLDTWCSWKDETRKDILIYKDVTNEYGTRRKVVGYHWDKIHGKKRKWIKFEIKKIKKRVKAQYEMWNKYVGKDILYVHSRCGGYNWGYFGASKLLTHPDFLDRCDDYWDGTYCDIYFKINEVTEK